MANRRRKINADLIHAVHLRSRFSCCYCGRDLHSARPGTLSVEHLTPHSRGGTDTADNLITACMPCNRGRGTKPIADYATPGARRTIRNTMRRKLNLELARALRLNRTGAFAH